MRFQSFADCKGLDCHLRRTEKNGEPHNLPLDCEVGTQRMAKKAIRKVLALHHKTQLGFDASERRRINALLRAANRKSGRK